jgi:hypothetical protein
MIPAQKSGKAITMFRIRRIYDDIIPVNKDALEQVKGIMRNRFS